MINFDKTDCDECGKNVFSSDQLNTSFLKIKLFYDDPLAKCNRFISSSDNPQAVRAMCVSLIASEMHSILGVPEVVAYTQSLMLLGFKCACLDGFGEGLWSRIIKPKHMVAILHIWVPFFRDIRDKEGSYKDYSDKRDASDHADYQS